jgi:signal transduction histidine kinase
VNPSNDTLDGLVNYLCKYAQDYFGIAGLRYRFDIPETFPPSPITPELRHNVFLAAKEAINNVVKHARAKSAWLAMNSDQGASPSTFRMMVAGFRPRTKRRGRNGLVNMSRRLKEVGETFHSSVALKAGPRYGWWFRWSRLERTGTGAS